MTFVDTNILIDVASANPRWADWSRRALAAAYERGPLVINVAVYAEFAINFTAAAECDAELEPFKLTIADIPKAAAFSAAQAFKEYRLAGGARTNVLPDFFIGAHAETMGAPLITRDTRRYRTYFPRLMLLAPDAA
ncbi:MAG TPA: type II toxin-antitoxin system VapC family toxin [Roseiarcus sp.]|nr:type II toxin-antitoxin system VapC family toxin [Roseiarcus sp.]